MPSFRDPAERPSVSFVLGPDDDPDDGRSGDGRRDGDGRTAGGEDLPGGRGGRDGRGGTSEDRVPDWWPGGAAAALTGLLLVLVAWLGASPVVQAVSFLFPVGEHSVGTDAVGDAGATYGPSTYFGISPYLIPVVSFGVRALLAFVAAALGLRARRTERSPLAGACVASAVISAVVFVAAAVAMIVGVAAGHGYSLYGVF